MIEAIELTSTRRSRGPGGPVEQVSFDVYPGQVTALLGAPGAGKSTVLRMMAELEPACGRTLFSGRPYHALRPAVREVGLALNPDAVHPGRTVQAHLQLYSAAGGVPKARLAEVLEITGLSTQAAVRCGRLDAGQRQRLAIAAALLGDPSALILDEPHALDSHGMSWFHALIRAYAAQGRTVLVAATDPDSLAGTADHVVVLRRDEEDGVSRVIASRPAAEVFDEHRALVVQVRSPQAARLAAALEAEGARLSAAGPGALQVRGLDRARIGEVAHLAGVCLHELSEIGHDDDVFGLRPVPRQKELLPGRTPVLAEDTGPVTPWSSGVRLVSTTTPPRGTEQPIEEAEVVEPSSETAVVVAEAPARDEAQTADDRGRTGVPGQSASQEAAERPSASRAESDRSPAEVGRAQVLAAHAGAPGQSASQEAAAELNAGQAEIDRSLAEVEQAQVLAVHAGAPGQLSSQEAAQLNAGQAEIDRSLAEVEQAQLLAAQAGAPGSGVRERAGVPGEWASQKAAERQNAGRTESDRSPAEAGQAQVPAGDASSPAPAATSASAGSTEARWQAAPWWQAAEVTLNTADQPNPDAATNPELAADAGSDAVGTQQSPAPELPTRSMPSSSPSPTPPAAAPPHPKRAANRAFGTFRRSRGKAAADTASDTAAETSSATPPTQPTVVVVATSAPPQPAVPFTVAAEPAPPVAAEGMTPWRAVAARAVQHQQVPVVEAASEEQEASA